MNYHTTYYQLHAKELNEKRLMQYYRKKLGEEYVKKMIESHGDQALDADGEDGRIAQQLPRRAAFLRRGHRDPAIRRDAYALGRCHPCHGPETSRPRIAAVSRGSGREGTRSRRAGREVSQPQQE